MNELIESIINYDYPENLEMVICLRSEGIIKLVVGFMCGSCTASMYLLDTNTPFFHVFIDNDDNTPETDIQEDFIVSEGFEKVVEWILKHTDEVTKWS